MAIKVFGITGTNGKTTVACILRNILMTAGFPCGLIGTIQHTIGNQNYEPVNTTPGADLLKEFFHQMTEENIDYCVMEASSHGIEQGRMDHIQIDYGGFTNLTQDHLDYHKTMEAYYQTKKKLFLRCTKGALVNLDNHYGMRLSKELKEEVSDIQVMTYSSKEKSADYYCKIESEDITGSQISIWEKGTKLGLVKMPIPGRHFIENAMLAVGLCRMEGIDFQYIALAIAELPKIPGRIELIGDAEDTLGIVDYAHTPDGLKKLLETTDRFKRGKVICVFGCGGFRDKGKRSIMGEIAGTYSDYCIITNDNPRGEPPENIAQAIEEGLYPTGCDYCIILDRYQAIKRAVLLASKWDTIVVAGKGHEKYQLTAGRKLPFDDSKLLKEMLEKKYEKTYD